VERSVEGKETVRGEAVRTLQMERLGWRRRLQKERVKCYCFKLFFCFFQSKMRYSVKHCCVNWRCSPQFTHIHTVISCVHNLTLSWGQYIFYSLCNSVSVLRLQTHPNSAVGVWCKSNFVQVRIKCVDSVCICVCVHTHTHTHTHQNVYLHKR
jgi:hypothetical protein